MLPDSVTARWIHWLVGSWPGVVGLMRCSLPPPEVVMAKRGPVPALTVRNMLVFGPEPKSKTRDHCGRRGQVDPRGDGEVVQAS